jgi:hypothetical protein
LGAGPPSGPTGVVITMNRSQVPLPSPSLRMLAALRKNSEM